MPRRPFDAVRLWHTYSPVFETYPAPCCFPFTRPSLSVAQKFAFFRGEKTLKAEDDGVLLGALADAIGVYYNATGDVECFCPAAGANNESSVDGDNWNWQVGVLLLGLACFVGRERG